MGVLLDLGGPKIRIEGFRTGKVVLAEGQAFVLDTTLDSKAGTAEVVGVAYKDLPKDVVARLNAELKKALASPAVQERYKQLDTETDGGSPEEFLALAKGETVKWAEVVKRSGAKVD